MGNRPKAAPYKKELNAVVAGIPQTSTASAKESTTAAPAAMVSFGAAHGQHVKKRNERNGRAQRGQQRPPGGIVHLSPSHMTLQTDG